jgi:hypothetical protein
MKLYLKTVIFVLLFFSSAWAADWSNPNPRSGPDAAAPLLLKHELNFGDLYQSGTGKLNLLKGSHAGPSSPLSPSTGQAWWDSSNSLFKIYNGSAWTGKVYDADLVDGKNPGSASGLATLDANTRLTEPATTIYDGTGNRSASPTPAANTVPVRDASGNIGGGPGPIGEISNSGSSLPVAVDMGTVTAGDIIYAEAQFILTGSYVVNSLKGYKIEKASGTATITCAGGATYLTNYIFIPTGHSGGYQVDVKGIVRVTGNGTLVLQSNWITTGESPHTYKMYAFFYKKQ